MRRILVIDDEAFVREAMQRVLASATVSVMTAADAAAGLDVLRESAVDLVIIDVVLPKLDGVAAIKEIRRDFPAVRIIALSGGGNFGLNSYRPNAISTSAYLAACSLAGADGTLPKPFETTELRALIGKVLDAPKN